MAKKRMFSLDIVDNDDFLNLPLSTQALYFQLSMRADDDGFIGNYKRLISYFGAKDEDFKILVESRFILIIGKVAVIKHWKINNYIQTDRYSPTKYQDEFSKLRMKPNSSYTELEPARIQNGKPEKKRVDKNRKEKEKNNVQAALELFESLWKLYPFKRGKSQISDTKKKQLLDIGQEQMIRAIDRYKADLDKDKDWRKPQNGSTFFNSGYVDYLDENYSSTYESIELKDEERSPRDRFERLKSLGIELYDDLIDRGIIEEQSQSIDIGGLTDDERSVLSEMGCI